MCLATMSSSPRQNSSITRMQTSEFKIQGAAGNAAPRLPNSDLPHSLFISDLHLSACHTQSMAAFLHFIATKAPQAESLYILGDLFDYWAGDDDKDDPFFQQVTGALRSLYATRVYLMRGNRDLLMGEILATHCNATLLNDPTQLDLYGTPTLLSHGDTLCTDDIEYQRYRNQVNAPQFQKEFLSRPLIDRKTYIEQLRKRSNIEKQHKNIDIMDVNSSAVANLLRDYNYPRLIHGHTHRAYRHEHLVDDHLCERWVLGDWDNGANALRVDKNNIRRETYPAG